MNDTFGVLDLGSNSFHLVISEYHDNLFRKKYKKKEYTYLGSGLKPDGTIEAKLADKSIQALDSFKVNIEKQNPTFLKVIATNSFRRISDYDFLTQSEKALGNKINIITPLEEANLIYQGVTHTTEINYKNFYIIDIGGSSSEVITVKDKKLTNLASFQFGSSTINNYFFDIGDIKRQWYKACFHVFNEINKSSDSASLQGKYVYRGSENKAIDKLLINSNDNIAFGGSGTIKAVHKALKAILIDQDEIDISKIDYLVQILLNQHDKVYDSDFKKITSVINPERLRVFLAGLSILHSLMVILDISVLSRANGALREGAMYELLKDSNIKS